MPYFHIDITDSENTQFVVNAADRKAAEMIAMTAAATGKCDNKKIVKIADNRSSAISVSLQFLFQKQTKPRARHPQEGKGKVNGN